MVITNAYELGIHLGDTARPAWQASRMKKINLALLEYIFRHRELWLPANDCAACEDMELLGLVVWEGEWWTLTDLGLDLLEAHEATLH